MQCQAKQIRLAVGHMSESNGFILLFFLPLVGYLLFFRCRLDQEQSERRHNHPHRGRQFCGIDGSGNWHLLDPGSECVSTNPAPGIAAPEPSAPRCWEPVH